MTSIRNGGRDGGRDGGRLAGSSSVRSYEQRAQGPMLFIQSQHCLQAESVEVFVAERVVESLEGFAATNRMEEVWKRHCHELE